MTYLASEKSQHDGKPVELYRFSGTYANFYYTSGPKKVTYQAPDEEDPHDYLPIAMRRSEINCGTQDDDGLDLTIELAVTNEVVQIYAFQASPPTLDLTIFRFHTLADVVAYWTGPVNDIQVANGVATIRSPSTLAAALATNIPNFYFQSPCNNVLFDPRCKVLESDWTDAAEVLLLDGRAITVDSVGTLEGKLIGGEVRLASGERRMISAEGPIVIPVPGPDPDINAYQLLVNFPFSEIEIGDTVNVTAGCDLAYTGDCRVKFNNNKNFGGFPFIPAANPFQSGIDPAIVPLPDLTCLPFTESLWRYQIGDNAAWAAKDFDDSGWPSGETPFGNAWPPGVGTFIPANSTAWFRTRIGPYVNEFIIYADDTQDVYCDGVLIGSAGFSQLVTPPDHGKIRTIAVRVHDLGGNFKFYDALLGHGFEP